MDVKSKVFIIILGILFIASGFFAYKFYTDYQNLFQEYAGKKEEWSGEKSSLEAKVVNYRRQFKDTSARLASVQEELNKWEKEAKTWQSRFQKASEEKDKILTKLREVQKRQAEAPRVPRVPGGVSPEARDVFWAQVIKEKATLQARLEELGKAIGEAEKDKGILEDKNKGLDMTIKTLKAQQDEMQRKIAFNERTVQILSQELVKEKEARRGVLESLEKYRVENLSLKRDVKRLTSLKEVLEKNLAEVKEKRTLLSRRIDEMESTVKDKTKELVELGKKIEKSSQAKNIKPQESKAVELPPIVVKPKETAPRPKKISSSLQGHIIAVNKENNFVVVDIGEDRGLKAGGGLGVYRNAVKIANLEVIETRREISACDIKEVRPGTELRTGDIVK